MCVSFFVSRGTALILSLRKTVYVAMGNVVENSYVGDTAVESRVVRDCCQMSQRVRSRTQRELPRV